MPNEAIFYVYVLFDHLGIPRYIGKGKGRRWLAHEAQQKTNHRLKNHFLRKTITAIGTVPKVKLREGLSEQDAFAIEAAFIKAIGRYPDGPLVNLTDKRNGPTSARMKEWQASRTPEQRSATLKKSAANVSSETRRANALSIGREVLAERMKAMRDKQTPEKRAEIARKGGLATAAKRKQRLLDQKPPTV